MMTARLSDKDSKADVLKVFSLFDVEGKGRINLRDLKRVASELGEPISGARARAAAARRTPVVAPCFPNHPSPPLPSARLSKQRRSCWK